MAPPPPPRRRRRRALLGAAAAGLVALAGGPAVARTPAQTPAAPNDPGAARQWGLARIDATTAWATATGAGVTIAVVDSGVDVNHPDLAAKVVGAADCVGHDDLPGGCAVGAAPDQAGHGTHVAGIALALTDNGVGVAGVAPLADLLAVKVLTLPPGCAGGDQGGCDAQGRESDVAEGVRWAVDNGADVVNLSLGNVAQELLGPVGPLRDALAYALANGVIPVLAGGNDALPGRALFVPGVVVVAATDRDDRLAPYSSGVGNVERGVAAPGGLADDSTTCQSGSPRGILSTWFNAAPGAGSSYACLSGTSMAAPFVSGALAVLLSAGLTPDAAVDRLLAGADDLGAPGRDPTFGYGRVNLARSLQGLAPTGQPIRATGDGPPATADTSPTTTATTTPVTAAVAPPTEAPPTVPVTEAPAPPVEEPPPTTAPGEVAAPVPEVDLAGDDLPTAVVTLAVLLVVVAFGLHGWRVVSTSALFTRTPPR